jgi:hypothetical protein
MKIIAKHLSGNVFNETQYYAVLLPVTEGTDKDPECNTKRLQSVYLFSFLFGEHLGM